MLALIADEPIQSFQYSFENVELDEMGEGEDDEQQQVTTHGTMMNHDNEILNVVGTNMNRKYRNYYTTYNNKMQGTIKKLNHIKGENLSRIVSGNVNAIGGNNVTTTSNWTVSPYSIGGASIPTVGNKIDSTHNVSPNNNNHQRLMMTNNTTTTTATTDGGVRSIIDDIKFESWPGNVKYVNTNRGNKLLYFEGHRYIKNNIYGSNIYWKCTKWHTQCKGRAITSVDSPEKCIMKGVHNHPLLTTDDMKTQFY